MYFAQLSFVRCLHECPNLPFGKREGNANYSKFTSSKVPLVLLSSPESIPKMHCPQLMTRRMLRIIQRPANFFKILALWFCYGTVDPKVNGPIKECHQVTGYF